MSALPEPWLIFVADDDAPDGERYVGMVYSYAEADRRCCAAAFAGIKAWARPYSYIVKEDHHAAS